MIAVRSWLLSSLVLASLGCAANPSRHDAGPDAGLPPGRDAGPTSMDAAAPADGGGDLDDGGGADAGGSADAGSSAESDGGGADAGARDGGGRADAAAVDASAPDGGRDAAPAPDGGIGCPAGVSPGDTLSLSGSGDLAMYPDSQVMHPFAPYDAGDQVGITWDTDHLYLTLVTSGLAGAEGQTRPLHVYVEAARSGLPAATTGSGKEYSGQTPIFEFTPTHVIAVRRVSEVGGIEYNGVYTPADDWTRRPIPLALGTDYWVSPDPSSGPVTLSVRVPWTALGCPTELRLSAHVVHGSDPATAWKDVVPTGATPWGEAGSGGAFYEIDLREDPAIAGWSER